MVTSENKRSFEVVIDALYFKGLRMVSYLLRHKSVTDKRVTIFKCGSEKIKLRDKPAKMSEQRNQTIWIILQ